MEYSHYLYLRGPTNDTLWLPEDRRYFTFNIKLKFYAADAYLPTYLPTYLPYLPTYQPTNLPTSLHTYL